MSRAQSHQIPFIVKEACLIRLLHVLCSERDSNRRPPSQRHLSPAPARWQLAQLVPEVRRLIINRTKL